MIKKYLLVFVAATIFSIAPSSKMFSQESLPEVDIDLTLSSTEGLSELEHALDDIPLDVLVAEKPSILALGAKIAKGEIKNAYELAKKNKLICALSAYGICSTTAIIILSVFLYTKTRYKRVSFE